MNGRVVVVGASVAGVRTAQALRTAGHTGEILLLSEERTAPYDKPPLSKQYLAGEWSLDRLALLGPDGVDDLEVRTGARAVGLDPASRVVELSDDSEVHYDTCVVATGARARPHPWTTSDRVHVLRNLDDSDRLRGQLGAGRRVVVVGAGFIGSEVASTARRLGSEVLLVDPVPVPLARAVGAEVGYYLAALHGRHGGQTRFGTGVANVQDADGCVEVQLSSGEVIEADVVVVGIGAVPNDQWLSASGLEVNDGLVCDRHGRSVDDPSVFAAGDVARFWHERRNAYVRVEHWTNAVEMAAIVAHNIAHPDDLRCHSPVEYVWTDQYDWKIQIAGRPGDGSHWQTIGSFETQPVQVAVLSSNDWGDLIGAVTINWPRAMMDCRRSMAQQVDADTLYAMITARRSRR